MSTQPSTVPPSVEDETLVDLFDGDSHQCKGCGGSVRWGDYCGSCAYERRRGRVDGPPCEEPPALYTPGAQAEHLERVTVRIGAAILAFCRDHRERGRRFYMDELRAFVEAHAGSVAPASPDRVLRQLRQSGRVQYRVVSRRESLYEVVAVNDGVQEEVA